MTLYKTTPAGVVFLAFAGWAVFPGLAQIDAQLSPAGEHKQEDGFSDVGKAALSRQLSNAVDRGDTPGVVALVVGRDGVLYEGAAGRLNAAHTRQCPRMPFFQSHR